ncbi:MAG: hypothetical protein HY548_07750 [Elusimicrobia bacterium]|nr:hypothetical protein [Elusimicrobiota bacterium]
MGRAILDAAVSEGPGLEDRVLFLGSVLMTVVHFGLHHTSGNEDFRRQWCRRRVQNELMKCCGWIGTELSRVRQSWDLEPHA